MIDLGGGGKSLPPEPLPSGNVIGDSTVERESKPKMLVHGDWSFKVRNNGNLPWPEKTVLTLDEREDLVDGITPIEIVVGKIMPQAFYTV